MQDEHISNLPAAATPYPSQQQASKLISSKFVPETRVQRASSAKHRPDEKIIYRNVNLFDMNEKTLDRCSTCSRSSSRNFDSNCCPNCHTVIKPVSRTMSRARGTPVQMSRGGGGGKPAKTNSNRFKQASQTDVDWNNLNDKIEDWFQVAKTPEQRIVYKFLKEIKDEKYEDESYAASVMGSLDENGQNVQSLEDILDNLKKYRHKFTKKNAASRAGSRAPPPPNASHNLPYIKSDLLTHYPDNMDKAFESSTWRVMRHVKSADIRNRYPLPKANPDYHFGNSSVFFTAGRAPKSTFLLHPDWV